MWRCILCTWWEKVIPCWDKFKLYPKFNQFETKGQVTSTILQHNFSVVGKERTIKYRHVPAGLGGGTIDLTGGTQGNSPLLMMMMAIVMMVIAMLTINNHFLQSTTASPVSHPAEQIRQFLESDSASWHPCSPEYVNYALALLVFAVRWE